MGEKTKKGKLIIQRKRSRSDIGASHDVATQYPMYCCVATRCTLQLYLQWIGYDSTDGEIPERRGVELMGGRVCSQSIEG
jgi:hypothetical protein